MSWWVLFLSYSYVVVWIVSSLSLGDGIILWYLHRWVLFFFFCCLVKMQFFRVLVKWLMFFWEIISFLWVLGKWVCVLMLLFVRVDGNVMKNPDDGVWKNCIEVMGQWYDHDWRWCGQLSGNAYLSEVEVWCLISICGGFQEMSFFFFFHLDFWVFWYTLRSYGESDCRFWKMAFGWWELRNSLIRSVLLDCCRDIWFDVWWNFVAYWLWRLLIGNVMYFPANELLFWSWVFCLSKCQWRYR